MNLSTTLALRALRRCIRLTHSSNTSTLTRSNTSQATWPPLERLQQPTLSQFRDRAFRSLTPHHLVSAFDLPAASRWVNRDVPAGLNAAYFQPFQDHVYLPTELTIDHPSSSFTRTTAPLSLFLSYVQQLSLQNSPHSSVPRMYIAQAPLSDLPQELQKDVPPPDLVLRAGRGDIYDSSLWMGPSNAARTPLHRDPNPNILVQIAGVKAVRLLSHEAGAAIFHDTQHSSHSDETLSPANGTIRGEEMMGQQGQQLDQVIWERHVSPHNAFEAILQPGDGIFIPNGWWHSIRGIGDDINISVNWWFR